MKLVPLKRQQTPLYAVANASHPKAANGRVVVAGGVRRIQKHPPYNKARLAAKPMQYTLPVGGYR